MTFKFSIIIIGYNSLYTLKKLLSSLNNLDTQNVDLEIVYIDDGSTDNSMAYFQSYKLDCKKTNYQFSKNKGRVYATNAGIVRASGDWLLFIQSNVTVDAQLLQHYIHGIINCKKLIFAGSIIYQSEDVVLQRYLNNKKRGINAYKQYQAIDFSHLLFGNCLIHNSVFKKIKLNLKLSSYGGEELDFAFNAQSHFPNTMVACPKSKVTRIHFPNLKQHCKRLEEYGENNLSVLSPTLQKKVIKFPFLLIKIPGIQCLIFILYRFGLVVYKTTLLPQIIMRFIFWLAILNGYYKKIK